MCSRIIANSYAFRTHMKSKHGIKGVSDVTNKYGRRLKDGTQKMHFENAHPEDVIKRFFVFSCFHLKFILSYQLLIEFMGHVYMGSCNSGFLCAKHSRCADEKLGKYRRCLGLRQAGFGTLKL